MELHMLSMFSDNVNIFGLDVSQTLLTSFISLIFFIIFIIIYNNLKKKNKTGFFVSIIDILIETMDNFFGSVSDKIPNSVRLYVLFLFVYILWNNIFGVFLDMFSTVVPFLEEYFRPVSTDIYFNAILAIFGVLRAIVYGIQNHSFRFFERYIPLNGIGMVTMDRWYKFPIKLIDILLGLFIGLLEFVGEITKILSLTLRLFGNIFAGAVLVGLIVVGSIALMKIPFLAPLLVFVMEIFISFLQAFVFAILVLIYFKMAEESH